MMQAARSDRAYRLFELSASRIYALKLLKIATDQPQKDVAADHNGLL